MKIKIAGASGYLGTLIATQLRNSGHTVSGINRTLIYDSTKALKEEIRNVDIVINLSGSPILKRWTKRNKLLIYKSRVQITRNLVHAINSLDEKERPSKFISASAIGIYKNGELHTESSQNFSSGFIYKVTSDWENEVDKLNGSVQKYIFRIGLVIGKEAKTIKSLITPIKLGLGAILGKGKQAFPYIHISDLVAAFMSVVDNQIKNGVYNLVAPEIITNKEFTLALAKHLNRSIFLRLPSNFLKLILGEAAILLVKSPIVEPKALINSGFKFEYTEINSALSEILSQKTPPEDEA